MADDSRKIIAQNKKAWFNYTVEEKIECGVELQGSEVKSLREGKVSFPDSFALIEKGEVWVQNCHITEYSYAANFGHNPDRKKRLLLHKEQIKLELGVCKGKKVFDKRADMKERDVKRELSREFKDRQR